MTSRVSPAALDGGGPGIGRVAVDDQGLAFAVATRFVDGGIEEGVHVIGADGRLVRSFATEDRWGVSGLSDIAVDRRSRVAVTSLVGGVHIFTGAGAHVATIDVRPAHGVAFADDGTLWIAAGDRAERWAVPLAGR